MTSPPDSRVPAGTTASPTPLDAGQWVLAAGLVLGVVLVAFEVTAVITALPTITAELGGDSLYGVSLAIYTLANMVSLVVAGRLADRRGPAGVYGVSVLVFIIGLIVAGAAQTMWILVLGRLLQGLGAGGFSPVAYMLVKRAFPEDRQPMMYVYLSAGWVLPSLVGPLFGGAVTDAFGWRWVFYGIVPLAVAVGLAGIVPMRAYGPSGHDGEGDDGRIALMALVAAVGTGAVVLAAPSSNALVALVGAAIGLGMAVPALRILLPAGSFTARPGYPAVLSVRLLAAATFIGVDGFIPLAADRIHGATPLVQGFVIVGATLSWTGGSVLSTKLPGLTPATASRIGFAVMALSTVLVMPVLWAWWPLWAVFLGWTVGGLGMGIMFNPTTMGAMSYARPGLEGTVSGQVRLADSVGYSIGYGISGAFVAFADRGQMGLQLALGLCFATATIGCLVGVAASRGVRSAD